MSFDPKNFLNFAKNLAKGIRSTQQTELRVIIGRAYYSAFLLCRSKLEEKYEDMKLIKTAVIHKLVLQKLVDENCGHEKSMLDSIKEMRDDADYDLEKIFAPRNAGKVIEKSDRIFEKLKDVEFT